MDDSGAGGARPVKMDWDWEEGGTGAKPSSQSSTVASKDRGHEWQYQMGREEVEWEPRRRQQSVPQRE